MKQIHSFFKDMDKYMNDWFQNAIILTERSEYNEMNYDIKYFNCVFAVFIEWNDDFDNIELTILREEKIGNFESKWADCKNNYFSNSLTNLKNYILLTMARNYPTDSVELPETPTGIRRLRILL